MHCIALGRSGRGAEQGLPRPEPDKRGCGSATRRPGDPAGGGGEQWALGVVSGAAVPRKMRGSRKPSVCGWEPRRRWLGPGVQMKGQSSSQETWGGGHPAAHLAALGDWGGREGGDGTASRRGWDGSWRSSRESQRIPMGCQCQVGWRGVLGWGKLATMGQVREGETGRPTGASWPRAGAAGAGPTGGEVPGAPRMCWF